MVNWANFGYVAGSNTFKDILRITSAGVLSNQRLHRL